MVHHEEMALPLLRVKTESGETWDDPSEDLLFELLSDMERGEEQFLIVDCLADATGQTFVQVARTGAGAYQVEYREGGEDRHLQAFTEDKRLVHSVITCWAFELPDWRDALPWAPLQQAGHAREGGQPGGGLKSSSS